MFKGKKEESVITNTVIGEGIKIEGANISGTGGLRIDGEYIGNITIDGNLIVGESGYVNGNISVKHALLAGKIDGNVACSAGVHLASSAILNGNIDADALVIDEGAVFTGNCNMGKGIAISNAGTSYFEESL